MKLKFVDGNFWLTCTFEQRDIPQRAGFRFERGKGFYTHSPQVAARLSKHADQSAKDELQRRLIVHKQWTGRIPHPPTCTPEPWQIPIARFALSRNRAYLNLPTGMGKTIEAALIMNALAARDPDIDQHFVYLCPPFLKLDVPFKLGPWRWHRTEPEIIADSMLDKLLTNEALAAMREDVRAFGGEMTLFVDEAHRYKNLTAQRTQALMRIVNYFDRVYFMSGTPDPNLRPMELYPILSTCAPETIHGMDQIAFGHRYCGAYHTGRGWIFKGASNVDELRTRVEGTFMITGDKAEMNLPPVRTEMVVVAEGLPPKLAEMNGKILREISPEDAMRGKLGENLHTSTYRKLLGAAKVAPALPVIKAVLEDTEESVIVVAIHKGVIARLLKGLAKYKPLLIDGSVPGKDRVHIARLFQTDEKRRLVILNAQAGGVGIDLFKASRVMFVEFTWVPGDNDQVRDRAWRRGQKNPVLCQFLVYKNSFDRVVLESLFTKQRRSLNAANRARN